MKDKKEKEKLLQWHPAFFAGLQIELSEEAEYLEFESEHMLSSKPMQLDVLIIKKDKERQIQKNIGRIFRTYNIVEYKSPDDYVSIDDFYKVYGYTCFYKADTGGVNEIKAEELTISFVCSRYPRELIRHLKYERHRTIERKEYGIYYISDELFPIQLIITKQLPEETNLWLCSLTNELSGKTSTERLVQEYGKHQAEALYQSVMDVIIRANEERFQVNHMCEALEELMKDRFEERERLAESRGMEQGISQGMSQGLKQGEQQKLLDMIDRLVTSGICSFEKACEIGEITPEEYETIKKQRLEK